MAKKDQADKAEQKAATMQAEEQKNGKGKSAKSKDGPEQKAAGDSHEGKKKRKGLGKLILVLLLVALLAGLSLCLYFDWLNLRTGMMDALCRVGPENRTYAAALQQREAAVSQKETELVAQQEDLQQREDKLQTEQTRLDKREADLNAREKGLNQQVASTTPVYRGELTEEKLAELKDLGKIYSSMDAEAAAKILPQLYGPADMAAIIFYMDKPAAATLLAALTPELSAQITTEMLRE